MKRLIGRLVVVFLAVLLLAASAMAQNLPPGDSRNAKFLEHWIAVVAENPQIRDFRNMPDGTKYYLPDFTVDQLKPGKYGIWGQEFAKVYGVSYEEFQRTGVVAQPKPEMKGETKTQTIQQQNIDNASGNYQFHLRDGWLPLAAFLALIAYALISTRRNKERERERELALDPVTSGPAMVPGGIQPNETERLTSFFDAHARQTWTARSIPGFEGQVPDRISAIEMGPLSGGGEVLYNDEREWRPRRLSSPRDGYQARYRFPNGAEVLFQTFVGCMNPVRSSYGELMMGFTFTPRQVVVPAPQPIVTPAPHPAQATALSLPPAPEPTKPGTLKFELRALDGAQPAMVRLTGVNPYGNNTVEFDETENAVTIRFTPASRPALPVSAADVAEAAPEARQIAG
jgi:hypothetical protein